MKKCGSLIAVIFIYAFSATAQMSDSGSVKQNGPDPVWISFGLGGSDSLSGFNVSTHVFVNEHCFSAQYASSKEYSFWGDPEDNRQEFSLAYGRCVATDMAMALGSLGVCYRNETSYEISDSYSNDPDDWFDTEFIYAARHRDYYGIIAKGQILLRSRHVGIGPSFAVCFTGERAFISIYLDLALGNLK